MATKGSSASDSFVGPPAPDLAAPLKTVHETATKFSTDAVAWVQSSTTNALTVLAIAIAAIVALRLLRAGMLRLLKGKTTLPPRGWRTSLYRMVRHTSVVFLTVLGCWAVAQFFKLPSGVNRGLSLAFMITGVVQAGLWARELVLILLDRRLNRHNADGDAPMSGALGVLSWLVNLAVWSITLLLLLDNLGVNVTALVAGLGIGGLAVGLAAQGILADLFSALSITFDRPFVRGDFIAFDDKRGTVEKVGLKTSHLRALTGELVVVSNTHLLGSVIHNYQRLQERRVVFTLGVVYSTPPDKIEKIQNIIKDAITTEEKCRFDRAHLATLADSALNFEVVYFYQGRDYNPYMDSHQAILLRILRGFAAEGIELAYPTQTVQLVRSSRPSVA